jgi:hypothetical protein
MVVTLKNVYDLAKAGLVYSDTPLFTEEGELRRITTTVTFILSNGQILTIDRGFEWDEASIPFLLRGIFSKSGKYAVSSLVHDALYYLTVHDREFVEKEFIKWMKATELSDFQIFCRYWGVKLFGGKHWRRNKNNPRMRCLNNRKVLSLI